MKERNKRFLKESKNGTVFYINKWGNKWNYCEPFKILYIKHNQYLIDSEGYWIRISHMNRQGYEFSAYLGKDFRENCTNVKVYDRLEKDLKDFYAAATII